MYNPCSKLNEKNAHKIYEKRKTFIVGFPLKIKKSFGIWIPVAKKIHDKKFKQIKFFSRRKN